MAFSAPWLTAEPAAETSRPTPEMVLQADTARAAATMERAMILRMVKTRMLWSSCPPTPRLGIGCIKRRHIAISTDPCWIVVTLPC